MEYRYSPEFQVSHPTIFHQRLHCLWWHVHPGSLAFFCIGKGMGWSQCPGVLPVWAFHWSQLKMRSRLSWLSWTQCSWKWTHCPGKSLYKSWMYDCYMAHTSMDLDIILNYSLTTFSRITVLMFSSRLEGGFLRWHHEPPNPPSNIPLVDILNYMKLKCSQVN